MSFWFQSLVHHSGALCDFLPATAAWLECSGDDKLDEYAALSD